MLERLNVFLGGCGGVLLLLLLLLIHTHNQYSKCADCRWTCRRLPVPTSVVFYAVCSSVSWEHPAVCSAAVPDGLPSYRTPLSFHTSPSRRKDRTPVESRSSDLGLTVLPMPCGHETGPHCSALCNTLKTCTFTRHLKEEEKRRKNINHNKAIYTIG